MRNLIFRSGSTSEIVASVNTHHDEQERVLDLARDNMRRGGLFESFGNPGDKLEITDGLPIGIAPEKTTKTNFERITASPEALGAFLAGLTTLDGPWDTAFARAFCDDCPTDLNCGPRVCPHPAERDNPLWWLLQESDEEARQ